MSAAIVRRIANDHRGVPKSSLLDSLMSAIGAGANTVGAALPQSQNLWRSRAAKVMSGRDAELNHQMKNLTAQAVQNIPGIDKVLYPNQNYSTKERAYRFAADPRVREALKWVPLTGAGVGVGGTALAANAVFGGESDEEKLARLLAEQYGVS